MANSDMGPISSFGCACTLLQVQLGLGMMFVVLGAGAASNSELMRRLEAAGWQSFVRSIARSLEPVPLLVSYALIQVQSASSDILTSTGLLVSGAAVLLGAFTAALGPILGSATGGPRFSTASRVICSVCAFGEVLLVLGSTPSGSQLVCASAFIRAALLLRAIGAIASTFGKNIQILEDLEPFTSLAPTFGALALLDFAVWGPTHVIFILMQPVVYVSALMAITMLGRFLLNATIDKNNVAELDVCLVSKEGSVSNIESLRYIVLCATFGSIALVLGRLNVGTWTIEASMSKFAIQWGDPLIASSVKLASLIFGTYLVEFSMKAFGGSREGNNGKEAHQGPIKIGFVYYMKSLVAPVQVLLLAQITARMGSPLDPDAPSSFCMMFTRYAFVVAASGVGLQTMTLLFAAVSNTDLNSIQNDFDTTGTLICSSMVPGKIWSTIRLITLTLLQGGLLFGCLSLGPIIFIVGGVSGLGVLYFLAPTSARTTACGIVEILLKVGLERFGSSFELLEKILEQRRLAQEAAAAKRAAAVARSLEAESAPKGGANKADKKPGVYSGAANAKKKGKR